MPRTLVRNILLAAFAVGLLMAVAPAPAAADEDRPATMALTGTGEIRARPDMAVISSGVVTEAKTAREALDANNAAMAEVVAAMKMAGVAEKDLQTSGFSVEPQYVQPPQQNDGRREPPRIVGYKVSNRLSVTVRDLDKLGSLLDLSVKLGANQVSGVTFGIADEAPLRNEARKLAMADALRKAAIYAEAADVDLERILSISESGGPRPPRPLARTMRMEAAEAVPVEAGELTLAIEVNVTWEID